MNPILKPIVLAMATELQRQHDQSGISDLVVSQTEEPHVLQLHGPIDLELLAQVVWDATLTQADKTVHDIVRDMTDPPEPVKLQTYLYDCDRGQGSVYTRLMDATHSETGEALVIYQGEDGKTWARPAEMFNEADRFIPLKED